MRSVPIINYRNVGISAHIDAGKTTVTERILFYAGIKHKIGEVHDGTATMDWMDQEQERGITITSAATTVLWRGMLNHKSAHQINIIDTPGHVDFTVEVERSLRVLDGVCLLYCGVGGVQPQSETVWRQTKKHQVSSICFVNKMDRPGANFSKVCDQLKKKLGANPIPITLPLYNNAQTFIGLIDIIKNKTIIWDDDSKGSQFKIGIIPNDKIEETTCHKERILEIVAETDDGLLGKYLNNPSTITEAEIIRALRKQTVLGRIQPVLCGSAFKNKGIQTLLDAMIDYLPSPADKPQIKSEMLNNGKTVLSDCSENADLLALAFKIMSDAFVGQLTFLRIYAGTVRVGDTILNASKNKKEKVGRILQMHANNRKEIGAVYAGDIAAFVGLKDVSTGDTFSSIGTPRILEKITFPEPVISQAIEPATKEDLDKLGGVLNKLSKEDPTFKTYIESETNQTVISGMGELHLEVMVERMRREFNIRISTQQPEVSYRETIKKESGRIEGKYIKQSGGRGQYGHVVLIAEPNEGRGFDFLDKIKGGVVPKEFVPAVCRGVQDALGEGILYGYQVIDVRISLVFGSFHEVDSSENAFRLAGAIACRKALTSSNPTLLEPIMEVEVEVPEDYLGVIMGDILGRRGLINSTRELAGPTKIIDAEMPLANLFGYSTSLRSLTQGRGTYTMKFKQYREVKKEIAEKLKRKNFNHNS
ncbi:elongation factor G [Candidatus Tremblaya phenacola PAVE]|nr:elongation factor G [Candidatus Tremblaya phenacola PAVE]